MQSDANTSRYVDTSSDAQVWHRLKNMRRAEVEVDTEPQPCPENAKPKASNFQKKVERAVLESNDSQKSNFSAKSGLGTWERLQGQRHDLP